MSSDQFKPKKCISAVLSLLVNQLLVRPKFKQRKSLAMFRKQKVRSRVVLKMTQRLVYRVDLPYLLTMVIVISALTKTRQTRSIALCVKERSMVLVCLCLIVQLARTSTIKMIFLSFAKNVGQFFPHILVQW